VHAQVHGETQRQRKPPEFVAVGDFHLHVFQFFIGFGLVLA
jgi:hypothetical protein